VTPLTGISGSLLPSGYLSQVLLPEFLSDDNAALRARELARWWRRVEASAGPASSTRQLVDMAVLPLLDVLAYRISRLDPDGERFTGVAVAASGVRTAVAITTWLDDLDRTWRAMTRSVLPSGAEWALIFAGARLRLVDATRTWTPRTLDIDLPVSLGTERSAIAAASILASIARPAGDARAMAAWVHRAERHGVAVCASLGEGVLEAITVLARGLDQSVTARRGPGPEDRRLVEQALTLVYRLLFLLFAEARAAVPTWHHVYRDSYTVESLCERIASRQARGLWKALQAISRLAHAGCRAGNLVVTPFNGRLFAPQHTPLGEQARVADEVVAHALTSLATAPTKHGRAKVAYSDLDVEQLGAVYERVLEYEPARRGGALVLTRTSCERKASGSFYTPRAVTDFLVRRALHPLVSGRTSEEILRLRVVDPAMGSGAFLVSACRYLSTAAERALISEGALAADASPAERASIRRAVAQRCVFGVDLNPVAVQLSRLSVWLSTLCPDRPLTFLDHHLATGNSLIGASVRDLLVAPRNRRAAGPLPALPLLELAPEIAARVLPERYRLAVSPEETPADVRAKERALAALSAEGTPLSALKRLADLWCAAWFWQGPAVTAGVYSDIAAALTGNGGSLRAHHASEIVQRAADAAAGHRFFHWDLEFPEIFFTADGYPDPAGGFDCVLGNPPWDVLRADTGDDAARKHARSGHAATLRFLRESGAYPCSTSGHANRYQLFLERALQLTRHGGRVAMIVPSGLVLDAGSRDLRRHMFEHVAIDALVGFDNRQAIFPIHRDVTFLLLTGTTGAPTERLRCAFGRREVAWLDQLPDSARDEPGDATTVTLTPSLIREWDPEGWSLPIARNTADVEVVAAVLASVPRLSGAQGWHTTFGRELNATDDRHHFAARNVPIDNAIPVVEGKHLEPFGVAADASAWVLSRDRAETLMKGRGGFDRARIAYREVASATNRLTLIAAILPPGTVSTHTVFCSRERHSRTDLYCLGALLNSLVANFLVRLQVTTHVTATVMGRLRVPRPAAGSAEHLTLVTLAQSLEQTGIAAGEDAYARVNAVAARLYGLNAGQFAHVLTTFPLLSRELRQKCEDAFNSETSV
jgi:hypothetical protein